MLFKMCCCGVNVMGQLSWQWACFGVDGRCGAVFPGSKR